MCMRREINIKLQWPLVDLTFVPKSTGSISELSMCTSHGFQYEGYRIQGQHVFSFHLYPVMAYWSGCDSQNRCGEGEDAGNGVSLFIEKKMVGRA